MVIVVVVVVVVVEITVEIDGPFVPCDTCDESVDVTASAIHSIPFQVNQRHVAEVNKTFRVNKRKIIVVEVQVLQRFKM